MSNLWVNVEDLGEWSNSEFAYDAVKNASFLLWALSGRKFSGVSTVTERYVNTYDPYLFRGAALKTYAPQLIQGQMYNLPVGRGAFAGGDLMTDGSSSRTRVRLRGRKVTQIHAVRNMRGEIIDPTMYYLADHATLMATVGAGWVTAPIEVTYSYGNPPPFAGKAAARTLATEFVKMYEGQDCALPHRVTSITRQGVTYTLLDDQAYIDELKTGLYVIDLFLKSVNPDKARARARVFTPDIPRARRTTGNTPESPLSAADLYVGAHGGSVALYLSEIGGTFLLSDPTWTLSGTITSWGGARVATITTAPVLDSEDETLVVFATYAETVAVLGMLDPGMLDIYAERPSLEDPSIPEIVNITTANAIIQLGSPGIPIYTA